ncbi:MAG: hypothetical protein JSV56_11745 [Methanomassiliicoccales archaeon]|nr:MAG: hypothetical protein JSV56_11745 [Methanomassiliicoccales archaeon]
MRNMDDSDGVIILIFVAIGLGVLILAVVLSILVLDFSDKFHTAILIGELITIGILGAGILKIRADLSI